MSILAAKADNTVAAADPDFPGLSFAYRFRDGMAELEYAIAGREALKGVFSRWMVLHIAAAIVMYPLLVLHIWNGIYYGLRWLG